MQQSFYEGNKLSQYFSSEGLRGSALKHAPNPKSQPTTQNPEPTTHKAHRDTPPHRAPSHAHAGVHVAAAAGLCIVNFVVSVIAHCILSVTLCIAFHNKVV